MKRIQLSNSTARPLRRWEAISSFALLGRAALLVVASLSVAGYAGVTGLTPSEEPEANATIVWGRETNRLQAGLQYEGSPGRSSFGPGTKFVAGIRNLSGKEMDFFWIPPETERYRVSLLDDHGKPVQRTAKGQSVGQPLRKHPVLKRSGGEYTRLGFEPSTTPYFLAAILIMARSRRRVRAPGLQKGGFVGDVGRIPSPGGDSQGHNENC